MKIYSLLAFVIMVVLSLVPPIDLFIRNPPSEYWLWMVLIAGFFGFFTIFIKTNFMVKFIAVFGFLNCFFSAIPYVSFTSYVSLVLSCYLYICCSRIEHWDLILKGAQTVLFLNIFILIMALWHKDNLMNFSLFHVEHFGSIGQHMQMGSLAVVLTSLLISLSPLNMIFPFLISLICGSVWSFFVSCIGLFILILGKNNKKLSFFYLSASLFIFLFIGIQSGKFEANKLNSTGRLEVWKRSIELTGQRPWLGWGIGTYKDLFNPLSHMHEKFDNIPYRTAHNSIVQLLFEVGYPFTICLCIALGWLIFMLWYLKQWICLSGLLMVFTDSLVHFPDRMIQSVPLIVILLAFIDHNLRRINNEPTLQ